MILSNIEVRKFIRNYILLLSVSIVLVVFINFINLNIVKQSVIENNQAIIGNVVDKHPELEQSIIDIITQNKSREYIKTGENILNKYNYNNKLTLFEEPILNKSIKDTLIVNLLFTVFVFIMFLSISFLYFNYIYKNIKDMTDYVYYNSEGTDYEMKNKNQEGQIGLLKTELLKMTVILKEKVSLLNEEKNLLDETISNISHQLKTPMTSLILLNDLMYGDLPIDNKIEFLDKMKSQLSRIEWLIKRLLMLSKLDAKVIKFKKNKVNIYELINKSISELSMIISTKNIHIDINGDKEASFIGDMNWSIESLTNIIKNCAEHTQKNPTIKIDYEENYIYSKIIISDNGEGIDDEDLNNIFKRFYKAKNSKSDSVGIGLAISKTIIENQNGNIYAKSKKGIGSEFYITFYKEHL